MIQFPSGFDIAAYVSEIFTFAVPFVAVSLIIVAYVVIKRILNRV